MQHRGGNEGKARQCWPQTRDLLQIQRREKEEADHGADVEDTGTIGARALDISEQAKRKDRLLRTTFDQHEGAQHDDGGAQCRQGYNVPSRLCGTDESVDECGHAQCRSHRTRQIEHSRPPICLVDVDACRDNRGDADREIDQEPDAPGEPVGKQSANDETDCRRHARCGAVQRDSPDTFFAFIECGLQESERRWREDRGSQSLDRTPRQHPCRRLRGADGDGGDGEDRHADDEHPTAAEYVPGTRAKQEEATEGQRIGALNPGKPGVREAELVMDLRQTCKDDGDVEHDHHVADEDDREDRCLVRWRGNRGCVRHCSPIDLLA